jgi:hypothetical protein
MFVVVSFLRVAWWGKEVFENEIGCHTRRPFDKYYHEITSCWSNIRVFFTAGSHAITLLRNQSVAPETVTSIATVVVLLHIHVTGHDRLAQTFCARWNLGVAGLPFTPVKFLRLGFQARLYCEPVRGICRREQWLRLDIGRQAHITEK